MDFLARRKSFAIQGVGLLAPCVKEQGETPFDCAPDQGDYSRFAGWNTNSPFHYKPFHLLMIFGIF